MHANSKIHDLSRKLMLSLHPTGPAQAISMYALQCLHTASLVDQDWIKRICILV